MNILKKIDNKIPKYQGFKAKGLLTCLLILLMIVSFMGYYRGSYYNLSSVYAQTTEQLNQTATQAAELQNIVKEQTAELEAYKAKHPDPTKEEIEAYVRMIFKKDNPNIALSVSHMECNPKNKAYPKCHNKSAIEHSVGIFQINLYNAKQWIHAARIPGSTMEEKIIWLENPFNNTLYAYWVYSTSGWSPWTTYTKGLYLNDPLMKGAK